MTDIENRPEEIFPPAFWTPPSEEDMELLKSQNRGRRFDAGLVYAVASRCSHGCPQVTVCYPATADGRPFPTLLWLTCPHLCRLCGVLESNQMIAELEAVFAQRVDKVKAWHRRYVFIRENLLREEAGRIPEAALRSVSERGSGYGVGGINWRAMPFAAKCLHLQTATMLGIGGHPAEEWLMAKLGALECADAYCRAHAAQVSLKTTPSL